MKKITLTRGYVALVDDEDYDWLNQWKWHAHNSKGGYVYATRNFMEKGVWHTVKLHRLIMNTPKNMQVDHIDHDTMNNQKCNLRNCTKAENSRNRRANGVCHYLGVTMNSYSRSGKKSSLPYRARISHNGVKIYLGYFLTEEDAARAYDKMAIGYFGEFANLNFKTL